MKEKTIVAAFTLAGSLLTYFYAKQCQKDAVPYVMMGGFVGSFIGESLILGLAKKQEEEEDRREKKSGGKNK
jgi:uncharacterized membrane protein YfcA